MSFRRYSKYPQRSNQPKGDAVLVEKEKAEDFNFQETPECQIFDFNTNRSHYTKTAFLSNFRTVNIKDEDNQEKTVLMLVLYDQSGEWLTGYIKYSPYFLVRCAPDSEAQVVGFLEKRFEGKFSSIKPIEKIDLEALNHLSGKKTRYLKLSFSLESEMIAVKSELLKKIDRRRFQQNQNQNFAPNSTQAHNEGTFSLIEEVKEHDINYATRVCIDYNIRVSYWYNITVTKGFVTKIKQDEELIEKPEFSIIAFDIETTKLPLKFPDARIDSIIMISYVIDGNFFLITNREILSADVAEFGYSPKPDISGTVMIYNEENEKSCLLKFFKHIKAVKPLIITSFNGDYFDIPFIAKRCEIHGLNLSQEIGLVPDRLGESYTGKYVFMHLDCYYWVKRDAFLPHGSHGLKAVTKAKLGYSPIEVDPEEMVAMARQNPQKLCEYSVSDAVATYYLYMKHIHDFIFALCTIVPLTPDEVLRRGSGTLCENLLMAEAYRNGIAFPNKKIEGGEKYYNGHLIEAETYVGGYVECLNNGAYRADLKSEFKLSKKKYEDTIEDAGKVLEFFITVESGESVENISNFKEVKSQIEEKLANLLQTINESENNTVDIEPLIYHVDVASMYPNIILTNRLQPTAIVNEQICSNCLFNESKNRCKREMGWDWKASYFPISRPEYEKLKLENDKQNIKAAIKQYSQKHYKCQHKNVTEYKENTVCMRENPFYVDTIRAFRDRRYKYKELAKTFSKKEAEYRSNKNTEKATESNVLSVLYDSLQLAHKIILNSFYGYVMKRGARWYSMEMAGMVTYTGAKIIQESKKVMDALGKPLELDTDGIWTLLPTGFPEKFNLKLSNGNTLNFSFICSLLNWTIYDKFKNEQYQELKPVEQNYNIHSEMTIFFEIDGPYRAMIIPAAKEENKKLKKRYVVFNFEGKITEIKGFEIKRRGELGIIKVFQSEIFGQFLKGSSLKGLYDACSETARRWISIIKEKGANMEDPTLIELLGETKVLSRNVEDYGVQKGIALTAAKRLSEFLGKEFLNGKGLNCHFIISKKPDGAPLNERVVPISVFYLEEHLKNKMLKRWLKVGDTSNETFKSILDWDYYMERLVNTLQKIIIIPAILQGLDNPIAEISPPDWLKKRIGERNNKQKQAHLSVFFNKLPKNINDIENLAHHHNNNESAHKKAASSKFDIANRRENKALTFEEEVDGKANGKNNGMEIEGVQDPSQDAEAAKQISFHLMVLKKKWVNERKRKKTMPIDKIQMSDGTDLQLFSQKIDHRIKTSTWNIQKIWISKDPGILNFWIIIDNIYQVIKNVHINRKIYVNSLLQEPTGLIKQVKKKLPREKAVYFLYEYLIEEEIYKQKLGNISQYLTNPEIEGVYETHVPLQFRSIVSSGSKCRMDISAINKGNVIDAESLVYDTESDGDRFYKNSIFDSDRKTVYVWNAVFKGKMLTVVFSASNIWVFKLAPYEEDNATKNAFKNHLRTHFIKKIDEFFKTSLELNGEGIDEDFELPFKTESIEFVYSHFIHFDAFKQSFIRIGTELAAIQKHCPVMAVFSSSSEGMIRNLAELWPEIPSLQVSGVSTKSLSLSSLDWHSVLSEQAINSFLSLNEKVIQIDQLAQYCRLPLCNLSSSLEDSLIYCIDVLFARELERNFYVWWYNESKDPDLGTQNIQTVLTEDLLMQFDLQCLFARPSLCNNYVFEIDVGMLHFNAVVVSDQFWENSFDIISGKEEQAKTAKKHVGGDQSFYGNNRIGFKIIKDLFMRWYQDIVLLQNPNANLLLQNLVRWMCVEESRFFDPLIKQTLDKIVKSLFDEFIRKLELLGARVIFASPYKLIIDTKKSSYQSATNFMNFVLQTIVKEPIFAYMVLRINKIYKNLLFYDINNFAGMVSEFNEVEEVDATNEPEEETLNLHSEWKMLDLLPQSVHNYFYQIMSTYMTHYVKFVKEIKDQSIRDDITAQNMLEKKIENYLINDFSSQYYDLIAYINEQQRLEEFDQFEKTHQKERRRSSIDQYDISPLSRKGFARSISGNESEVIDDDYDEQDSFIEHEIDENEGNFFDHRQNSAADEGYATPKRERKVKRANEWRFPTLIGRSFKPENVALELTKILFEILENDTDEIKNTIQSLRSNFLNFMKISEFSEQAIFKPIFIDFCLTDVICQKCYLVRNINVFVDFDSSEKVWYCNCGNSYEPITIERKIVDLLNACYSLYISKESYCLKCKQTKTDFFSKLCSCSGAFKVRSETLLTAFEEELRQGMHNFKSLAAAANFRILADLVVDLCA
jgi:DNA polymerase epsilon subunit 1